MNASIDLRLDRIASALPVLVDNLTRHGYQFARPDAVLPGPESTVNASIHRIESEIGVVPYAVAQFWKKIGSVDLCGSHPDWDGCDCPDPLVIDPSSQAVAELQEFLDDREERRRHDFPYPIPISADEYHKEDVSGGMWYNVDCPATADDPIINDERHEIPFVDYLELALKMGGFSRTRQMPAAHLAIGRSMSRKPDNRVNTPLSGRPPPSPDKRVRIRRFSRSVASSTLCHRICFTFGCDLLNSEGDDASR